MSDKKTEALIKMNEAIAYLSEAFIEEDQIFNTIYDEIKNIKEWNKEHKNRIHQLEQDCAQQQTHIISLEVELEKQKEKNNKIVRILMED